MANKRVKKVWQGGMGITLATAALMLSDAFTTDSLNDS